MHGISAMHVLALTTIARAQQLTFLITSHLGIKVNEFFIIHIDISPKIAEKRRRKRRQSEEAW